MQPTDDDVRMLSGVERGKLRRAVEVAGGVAPAAIGAGVSKQTFAFALAGLEVRRGSLALIRAWLDARTDAA